MRRKIATAALDRGATWDALYNSMYKLVLWRMRKVLGPMNLPYEDAAQDVWLRLYRLGNGYWNPRGVNLVMRCVAIDWIRKGAHGTEDVSEPTLTESQMVDALAVPEIAHRILALPADQMAIISFRYGLNGHEELTFPEISQRLGLSVSLTILRFLQAKRNLKAMLA